MRFNGRVVVWGWGGGAVGGGHIIICGENIINGFLLYFLSYLSKGGFENRHLLILFT